MRYFLVVCLMAGLMISCDKQEAYEDWKPGTGEFSVQMDKSAIKQRDFFTFNFGGYVDYIQVYDGTAGHEYRFKDRTVMEGVVPKVSFSSYLQWGVQTNSLAILVSTDFAADKYDADEIQAAKWTDITSRFTLSTGTDNTASGEVALDDLMVKGKPLYFAFKYQGKTGTTQRMWTIKNFVIKNQLPNGAVQDGINIETAGWKQYSFANSTKVWTFNEIQMVMEGGNATSGDNLDWAITKALDFTKVEPDQPSHSVKSRFENMVKMYRLGYKNPGQYKLALVGKDAEGKEVATLEREVTIEEN